MPASRLERPRLLLHTLYHLRPAQVMHRVRLRTQQALIRRFPGAAKSLLRSSPPAAVAWPSGFTPLDRRLARGFPAPEANASGLFEFLSEPRELGTPIDWHQSDAAHLWRYHVHYFEWAWSFANHPDREWAQTTFLDLWRGWRASVPFGDRDAWAPYVASLRAWVMCGIFEEVIRGTRDEEEFLSELGTHVSFLRTNLELDVGGNHLIKNLKALVGLAIFLNDDSAFRSALGRLERELRVQVLPDGGHYERSPSYHCQVLADLIDIHELVIAAGRTPPQALGEAITKMREWLGAILHPDGDVPLFNDCTLVGHDRLALLQPAPRPRGAITVLESSGYAILRPSERVHLIADIGLPCPPELPAHAHADCLNFELSIDNQRLIIDSGTSTYEAGATRQHERSTAAHNTVEIDGADQTEVWGAFRAGRRARPTIEGWGEHDGELVLAASHDGYRHLPGRPIHRRTWRLSPTGVTINDELLGAGRHQIALRFHTYDSDVEGLGRRGGASVVRLGNARVELSLDAAVEPCDHAHDFGRTTGGACITARADLQLPIFLRSRIDIEAKPPTHNSTRETGPS